jgi:hypothetical protein
MADVRGIYLPLGEAGRKQGVDDFLAAGNSVDELLSLATTELREPPSNEDEDLTANVPYRSTPGGLIWDKPTQNGSVPTPLTNFTARIIAASAAPTRSGVVPPSRPVGYPCCCNPSSGTARARGRTS